MPITAIVYGLLAGISFSVSVSQGIAAYKDPQDKRLLVFAAQSAVLGAFGIVLAIAYQIHDPQSMVTALKWQITLAMLMYLAVPWFAYLSTGIGSRRIILAANVLLIAATLVNLASPNSLQYLTQPVLRPITLPWGEVIWQPTGDVGIWFRAAAGLALVIQAYGAYAFWRLYLSGRTIFALSMFIAALVTLLAVSQGVLVRLSLLESVHIGPLGFFVTIMIMSFALSRERDWKQSRVQRELRDAQVLQQAILDHAGYAIISCTSAGVITSFNPAAERMLGYSAAEMIGKSTPELFHDTAEVQDRAKTLSAELGSFVEPGFEVFVAKARRGLPNENEWTYVRKDGSPFPILLTVTALRDSRGEITGFLGIANDISERKRAQQALQESEKKYRLLFENMTTGFALHEIICNESGKPVDYRYLEINPAFEKLTGVPVNALLGKTLREIMPNTEDYWIEVFGNVALTGQPVAYENYSRELGRWYDTWVFSPRKNQFAVIFSDSSERKRQELALRNSEIQLRSTLDNTPGVAVQWFDRNGTVLYWNTASEKIYKISAKEAVGKTISDLLSTPAQFQGFPQLINRIEVEKTSVGPFEIEIHSSGDAQVFVLYTMFMIPGVDDAPIFVCMDIDITERKRAEAELQQHREHLKELVTQRTQALEAANRELEAFSYSVSHDLRAPLRAIDGFSQILSEDYASLLDTQGKNYLERIRSGSQRMAALIDDLLELGRISRIALAPKEINLSAVAEEIVAQLQASEPQREITVKIAPNLITRGDPQLVAVALTNLLQNAWKYTGKTQDAYIELGRQLEGANEIYYVRDNGAGFNMLYANKLFGAFQRLHKPTDFPGTGVGLATVHRIVQRHGGKVWAFAEEGKGATFYFTFNGTAELKSMAS